MRHLRFIGLAVAVTVAVAAQSLVGLTEQAPASIKGDNAFDALYFREIGPATMSGRIADFAVYEANPAIYYVATAHGGVWKTTNHGTTFEPQMQDTGHLSTGSIAISQSNPDLVWVGTGESANRQSVSWGDGVYKSTDGGKTYAHMGLKTSRHITRIRIDPRNNDIVYVAATGSLWGPGGERGVYKTTDGGRNWKQVLFVDDDTGADELVMHPTDSRILYATMYQRRRSECCFVGGGPGGGIFKTTDGGETWTKLTGGVLDEPVGRIGLDIYRKRPEIMYALIEGPAQPGGGRGGAFVQAGGGRGGEQTVSDAPTGLYRSDDAGATWRKVNNANPRPMYFSQLNIDPNDPEIVYFGGVGLHRTMDGGRTVSTQIAPMIHVDHHHIWINPANSQHVLVGNDGGMYVSYDQGAKWKFKPNLPVGLFYHVAVDNAVPFNICGGMQDNYSWCGPSAVRSNAGIGNHEWNTLLGGDGFVAIPDPNDRRIVFAESQDGNVTRIDRVTFETQSIRPLPPPGEEPYRWHWDTPLMFSPHDSRVLLTAANKVFRSTDRGHSWTVISPDLTSGQDRNEVVTMGVKNSEIRFSRNDGIRDWPTITALAESPKRAGILYAGTDDGNVSVTRDMGRNWTNVSDRFPDLPKGLYVSETIPSRFEEGRAYVTFDGHRSNDFHTWIFATEDFGQTWQPINGNLRDEVARTFLEDLKNPDVLYAGTETGIFVSLDRGRSWERMKGNMPTVRVDKMVIHPRDNALVVGTHGRSIWVLDNLSPVQEMAAAQRSLTDATLFSPPPTAMYRRPARDRNYEFWGDQTFFGENPPAAAVITWLLKKDVGSVALRITDATGREVREISGPVLANSNKAGIQAACWDLRVAPIPAPAGFGGGGRQGGGAPQAAQQEAQEPVRFGAGCVGGGGGFGFGAGTPGPWVLAGTYNVSLIVDGKTVETRPLRVTGDPEIVLTQAERKRLFDMAMELHELQRRTSEVNAALTPFNTRLGQVAQEVGGKADVPADVKARVESLSTEFGELAMNFVPAVGGRGGGGRGGGPVNPVVRMAQAKNGLMGGMWPTQTTLTAYTESKTEVTKLLAQVDTMLTRARSVSADLAKHGIQLEVPVSQRSTTTQ
jgi:photosystem II stability/assembly factor-like uncharacterized protein